LTSFGEVKVGDRVQYLGRSYIVVGFARLSSPTQHAVIEHVETQGWKTVPCTELTKKG